MSDWSERAFKRFQENASEQRRKEELELLRHSKIQSRAPEVWRLLVRAVETHATNFNNKAGRRFLDYKNDGEMFYINAPNLSVSVEFNAEEPSVSVAFIKPAPRENKYVDGGGKYLLALDGEDVWLIHHGTTEKVNIGTVAERILDPLVD